MLWKSPFAKILINLFLFVFIFYSQLFCQNDKDDIINFQPLSFEQADKKADSILALMTFDEKIALIGGDRSFFIKPFPRLNLSEVYMADATAGVHIRDSFRDVDLSRYKMVKSTAFPCPLSLAATWNPDLAYQYARSVGEECRAGGVGILLGPGMNIYRQSQCGRNFEYFGEDPFLAGKLIENYVKGVQSTGTAATLKHFAANNTDFYRRKSNSIVDERTLHEIYLPAFKAGIDAGAAAVMTSYNLINGDWCGQSEYVINYILRKQLGFKGLVMTDWWSVSDGEKLAKSGQDLEMPFAIALKDAKTLIDEGKVKIEDINRMAKSILRTCFYMKLYDRKKDLSYYQTFPQHEVIALQAAREGIVLLKNDGNLLPINKDAKNILLTGDFVKKIGFGGGAATVEGYDHRLLLDELKKEFGEKLNYIENPTDEQLKSADIVLCNIGTMDSEGWDRSFNLPDDQEAKVMNCVKNNPNTVVVVTSGSGIKMTDWNKEAKAIIYSWYPGQIGNQAIAEIISGKVNPSGKLPISIEKDFKDSPAYGYIPAAEKLYNNWKGDAERNHPVYDVNYKEGVLVGYRWYDSKNIEPLYPFGYGISYSNYSYSNLTVSSDKFNEKDILKVTFNIKNTSEKEGMEIAQLYVQDTESSVIRPAKELKGFQKILLKPGEEKTVVIPLDKKAFSFWNPETKDWYAEKGKFVIYVGSSSRELKLKKEIELM